MPPASHPGRLCSRSDLRLALTGGNAFQPLRRHLPFFSALHTFSYPYSDDVTRNLISRPDFVLPPGSSRSPFQTDERNNCEKPNGAAQAPRSGIKPPTPPGHPHRKHRTAAAFTLVSKRSTHPAQDAVGVDYRCARPAHLHRINTATGTITHPSSFNISTALLVLDVHTQPSQSSRTLPHTTPC